MVEENWFPQIEKELCTGCGDCIVICPTDALEQVSGVAVVTKPAACNYCGECETICPVEAIALPYQIVLESDL
ncbi:MAG: 4Fe-4S binding protein [Anaerolineae bacterium]|nr:4Fe-4S binding protein [Anaerolineae bacterium]